MFTSQLWLATAATPDFWVSLAALTWCDPVYGRLETPKGFFTDLASIPRLVRNLPAFDPDGRSRKPAVMHDWLYAQQAHSKAWCDAFLRDSMIAEGCSRADANMFYEAVHLFGHGAWAESAATPMVKNFATPADYAAWHSIQP